MPEYSCLTFGIEFEFCLATLADEIPDPDKTDSRQVRGLTSRQSWTLPFVPKPEKKSYHTFRRLVRDI